MPEHQWYYRKPGILEDTTEGPIAEAAFLAEVRAGRIKLNMKAMSPTRTKQKWCELKSISGVVKTWNQGQIERDAAKQAAAVEKARQKQEVAAEKAKRKQEASAIKQKQKQATENQHQIELGEIAGIADSQDPSVVNGIKTAIQSILTPGEEIRYMAVQKKPVALKQDAVVATTKRLIFYRPKMLGRFDFQDYLWRDLADAHMVQGLIGSTFSAQHVSGEKISMDYLSKEGTTAIYRIAQEMEEQAFHLRRQMHIEEKAAGAANISVNAPAQQAAPQPAPAPASTGGQDDLVARLGKLKAMFENDLITQEDFDRRKAEILAEL